MRTFHSSLSYHFPEIAEAIDLDLFKSLNDFGIQAHGSSTHSDLQEVRVGSTADPEYAVSPGTGSVTWAVILGPFHWCAKLLLNKTQNGLLGSPPHVLECLSGAMSYERPQKQLRSCQESLGESLDYLALSS